MSFNTFGKLFRFSTWGESHGPAIGCIVDGCPPNINLSEKDIQKELDKRKPGQSKFTTQRKEDDKVQILSGIFEGRTTGTPISLIIYNKDMRSKDYGKIKDKFRPGHADFTYFKKYGIRDYRGGGRSSARETAARVAAGAVAKLALKKILPRLEILGYLVQIGNKKINWNHFDKRQISKNPFWCPDKEIVEDWSLYLNKIRKDGNSIGAIIEVIAKNLPAGIGAPIYNKLDTQIASAMMSINAVKGVEIGEGMNAATLTGNENADEIRSNSKKNTIYKSNKSGGILGGISTGQDIITRFAVKPTSSILKPKNTIDEKYNNVQIQTTGRHDPCVGIRAVPVGEAMLACVLLDQYLINRGQIG